MKRSFSGVKKGRTSLRKALPVKKGSNIAIKSLEKATNLRGKLGLKSILSSFVKKPRGK